MSEPAPISPAPEPVDVIQAVWQLRTLICGLGAALLILSLCFNVFLWKQNRNITSAANARKQQLAQIESRLGEMSKFANELATYSVSRPELVAVFSRYGMQLKPPEKPSP